MTPKARRSHLPVALFQTGDDRGCRHVPRHLYDGRAHIGDQIDRNQDADPLGGQSNRLKQRGEQQERSTGNPRRGERDEDRGEGHDAQLTRPQLHAIELADE